MLEDKIVKLKECMDILEKNGGEAWATQTNEQIKQLRESITIISKTLKILSEFVDIIQIDSQIKELRLCNPNIFLTKHREYNHFQNRQYDFNFTITDEDKKIFKGIIKIIIEHELLDKLQENKVFQREDIIIDVFIEKVIYQKVLNHLTKKIKENNVQKDEELIFSWNADLKTLEDFCSYDFDKIEVKYNEYLPIIIYKE